jgi:hypothetical protein
VIASCRCGRRWTGLAQAHCTVCHRHFSTDGAADRHRKQASCMDPLLVLRRDGSPVFALRCDAYGATFRLATPLGGHWRCNSDADTSSPAVPLGTTAAAVSAASDSARHSASPPTGYRGDMTTPSADHAVADTDRRAAASVARRHASHLHEGAP